MLNEELQKELAEIEGMVADAKAHEDYTEKYFIIREGMVKLAGGFAQAALLSSLLSWTRHWLKTDNEVYKQIQKAAANNDLKKVRKLKEQIRQGWFWKTYRDMSKELFDDVSPKTCERYVDQFVKQGLLEMRPAEEKTTYRANWYKADIVQIKKALSALGYQLDHFKELRQNDESHLEGFSGEKSPKPAPLRTRQNDESHLEGLQDDISSTEGKKSPKPAPLCIRQNDETCRQNDEHLLYTSFTPNEKQQQQTEEQPKERVVVVIDLIKEKFEKKITNTQAKELLSLAEKNGQDIVSSIQNAHDYHTKVEPLKSIMAGIKRAITHGWEIPVHEEAAAKEIQPVHIDFDVDELLADLSLVGGRK